LFGVVVEADHQHIAAVLGQVVIAAIQGGHGKGR
jgi:hypothetical protein